ncbi:hypothetical protein NQ317_009285 [Molorchus minor]|uniref:Uncharacterized protein n=1 Tax=Molorchus minor TaxID=1323400 RepID=A0ABQ9JBS4_9CUCU|nr:hypothetical protein NQ317_009285 [Molorchus minor]
MSSMKIVPFKPNWFNFYVVFWKIKPGVFGIIRVISTINPTTRITIRTTFTHVINVRTISVPLPQLIPQFLTPLRHVFFNTTLTSFDPVSSISNCKLNQPAELRDLGAVTTAVN